MSVSFVFRLTSPRRGVIRGVTASCLARLAAGVDDMVKNIKREREREGDERLNGFHLVLSLSLCFLFLIPV